MFRSLSTSWELAKASYGVLRSDRQLIIFPLISTILTMIVAVTFIAPLIPFFMHSSMSSFAVASNGHYYQSRAPGGSGHSALYYIWAFTFYLSQYFVIFFANTALVSAAIIRLRGGSPTVADGFSVARSRIGSIFCYALIASTVGMVLRTIQERVGILGKIVTAIFGVAWTVATFLVTPVLVLENPGAIGAIKRSTALLKQTWGEQIVGTVGISVVFSWIMLGILVVFGSLFVAAAVAGSTAMAVTSGILLVLALLALALIQSALSGIYTAAVYLYAAEGFTPGAFDGDTIRGAFKTKSK